MTTPPDTIVYYNSACPVCDAGICYQRKQMQGSPVQFVDVHAHPEVAEELGIDLEILRERLHVRNSSGQLEVGDRAFVNLWAQSRRQRWMALVARPFSWLTGPLYNLIARALYRWNRSRGHW
jgi:predicted DCC family thiol-disulfide oxidoreductase YuxK